MSAFENMPVVREGVWLYKQVTPVRVQVVESFETWEMGDYEDENLAAENQALPCFFLLYEAAGSPGRFCNVIPNLFSLNAAVAYAEQMFPGIKWERQASQFDR